MSTEPDEWHEQPTEEPQDGPQPQPGIIRAAAVLWIIMAVVFFVFGLLNIVTSVVLQAQRPNGNANGTGGCATYLSFGIGAALFIAGQNLRKGKAKDVIVSSVLSILLGLFYGAIGVLALVFLPPAGPLGPVIGPVIAVTGLIIALGATLPGVMALAGRSQYLAWRAERRERRRRRRQYDFDHDDGSEDEKGRDSRDEGAQPWERGNRDS